MSTGEQPTSESEVDMGPPSESGLSDTVSPSPKAWPLVLAAVALIAVPAFFGYLLLRGDSAPSAGVPIGSQETSEGMGGSMSGSEDAEAPSGILPFSDIQATAISIEDDPSGAGAVLRVDTSIDVACAVAFGPTDAFGSLATDTDMAGGGHAVHQPLMRGLAPGATYFYSVQAIGPDGTLYQSDTLTFVYEGGASAPDRPQPPGPNVASLAQIVDVSSEYSDAFGARNAIDDDLATEWSSAGDGDSSFVTLRFSDLMIVEGVGFRTREMSDGTAITLSYTVTVDGGTTYGPYEAGPGLAVALVDFTGYQIRFDVDTSTGGNTGAVEVEVYGEAEM